MFYWIEIIVWSVFRPRPMRQLKVSYDEIIVYITYLFIKWLLKLISSYQSWYFRCLFWFFSSRVFQNAPEVKILLWNCQCQIDPKRTLFALSRWDFIKYADITIITIVSAMSWIDNIKNKLTQNWIGQVGLSI